MPETETGPRLNNYERKLFEEIADELDRLWDYRAGFGTQEPRGSAEYMAKSQAVKLREMVGA